jgi:hypothetical protein
LSSKSEVCRLACSCGDEGIGKDYEMDSPNLAGLENVDFEVKCGFSEVKCVILEGGSAVLVKFLHTHE